MVRSLRGANGALIPLLLPLRASLHCDTIAFGGRNALLATQDCRR
jgi:hypothetical protein